jgi:hypothetical protein
LDSQSECPAEYGEDDYGETEKVRGRVIDCAGTEKKREQYVRL